MRAPPHFKPKAIRDTSRDEVDLSDGVLLDRLLSQEKLSEKEEEAFKDMRSRLPRMMTYEQRSWAERVYTRLELDAEEPCANLVSEGKVKITAADRAKAPRYPWEMNLPLKPPGCKI